MAVERWEAYLISVLEALNANGAELRRRELIEITASYAGITDDERLETIASGQSRFENRVGWALTFLKKANAITSPARARFQITDFGRDLLARYPEGMTEKQLLGEIAGTEAALTWRGRNPGRKAGDEVSADKQSVLPEAESELDPVEQVETGVSRNNEFVAGELLTRLHDNSRRPLSRRCWTCSWPWDMAVRRARPLARSYPTMVESTELLTRMRWGCPASTCRLSGMRWTRASADQLFRDSWVRCRGRRRIEGCS